MGLEAADHIDELVSTNPTGTDQKLQGDDHIRLIKHVLKTDLPNITEPITGTAARLNAYTGLFPFTAGDFISASGAEALQKRTAAQVRSDVGADNASNLTSGTIPDARLSANVAKLDTANTWTANQTIDTAGSCVLTLNGTLSRIVWEESDEAADEIRWRVDVNGGVWILETVSDDNATTRAILQATRGTGVAVSSIVIGNTTDDPTVEIRCLDLTMQLDGTDYLVGYRIIPPNTQNGNYTLVLGDSGKLINKTSGGAGETITIPANASVAFDIGTVITIANRGGGTLTIAITSDTLELAGTSSTGSRTLADKGIATAIKVASTVWLISGSGLT